MSVIAPLSARPGRRREAHLVERERLKGEWGSELAYANLDHAWKARSR